MLDNLRGMAVFASVVQHGSFSGAAKDLGITTSAVSQQIRALENDLGVVLLHRSTRKLSLTEAGQSLYDSAKNIVRAAEEGRENVSQLRDGLLGNLRIATTPRLAKSHILPALSTWLNKHEDLTLRIVTSNTPVDMIGERVDLAVNFGEQDDKLGVPLMRVPQVLLASKDYAASNAVRMPKDLQGLDFITTTEGVDALSFVKDAYHETVKVAGRLASNDTALAINLARQGYGIVKVNALDAKDALGKGSDLVQVLPDYHLPALVLYAKTLAKDQQPAKVWRCLEVLTDYFAKI
ncbi:MAG: LysR family transcriptional regulator [Moraxella sp.]|nr:LysR family transcriptional regulator [Moraxella sp.]